MRGRHGYETSRGPRPEYDARDRPSPGWRAHRLDCDCGEGGGLTATAGQRDAAPTTAMDAGRAQD
jgi:hypothetical protein